ncbi:MAG: hypothetical protein N2204_01240, partial [Anaerolineae bacterium]|nr:hypothetical protein [Anaerolineae bacterium]
LRHAAGLALEAWYDPVWSQLDGAQVTVFEDTTTGVFSLLAARELLAAHDISLEVRAAGITADPAKGRALAAAGAEVFPSLFAALKAVGPAARGLLTVRRAFDQLAAQDLKP